MGHTRVKYRARGSPRLTLIGADWGSVFRSNALLRLDFWSHWLNGIGLGLRIFKGTPNLELFILQKGEWGWLQAHGLKWAWN